MQRLTDMIVQECEGTSEDRDRRETYSSFRSVPKEANISHNYMLFWGSFDARQMWVAASQEQIAARQHWNKDVCCVSPWNRKRTLFGIRRTQNLESNLLLASTSVSFHFFYTNENRRVWVLFLDVLFRPSKPGRVRVVVLHGGGLSGLNHISDLTIGTQWLPYQEAGVLGSALGLAGPVSVYCDWVR